MHMAWTFPRKTFHLIRFEDRGFLHLLRSEQPYQQLLTLRKLQFKKWVPNHFYDIRKGVYDNCICYTRCATGKIMLHFSILWFCSSTTAAKDTSNDDAIFIYQDFHLIWLFLSVESCDWITVAQLWWLSVVQWQL